MAQNYPAKLHINSMAAIPGQAWRDSGLLLSLTLKGFCLYLIPLCNHTGTEERRGNI